MSEAFAKPEVKCGDSFLQFNFKTSEFLARALSDLRLGLPVVITDADRRAMILAVETASDRRIEEFQQAGEAELVITQRRAETLKARVYDGKIARIVVSDRSKASWIRAIGDPSLDMQSPLKGPLKTRRSGDFSLQHWGLELARKARLLPAVLAKAVERESMMMAHLSQLEYRDHKGLDDPPVHLELVSKAQLPLCESIRSTIFLFRETNSSEEHCAVIFGRPRRDRPVLTRFHSACFTGDVLGSLKCDCQHQLHMGLARIRQAGEGVLLYINQEGRGIGLVNKIRAYALQDQGFDTVEANHRLGFEDDERDFRLGSEILRMLGYGEVRIMTNNPRKVAILNQEGIKVVERIPIIAPTNRYNAEYMAVKAQKSGHKL